MGSSPRSKWRSLAVMGLAALFLALACLAEAGTLTIQTSVDANQDGERVLVRVNVVNLGDEAAHKVFVTAQVKGGRAEAEGPEDLPPNQPAVMDLAIPFKADIPGTYAAVVWVRFHDANGYPFSSLGHDLFPVGRAPAASLLLRGQPATLAGEGQVGFELASLDEAPKEVSFKAFGPQELTLPQGGQTFMMEGRSKREVILPVSNFTALAGATYPILGLASYRKDGLHFVVTGTSLIKVAAEPDPLSQLKPFLIPAAVVLVLGIGLLLWLRRGGPLGGAGGKTRA